MTRVYERLLLRAVVRAAVNLLVAPAHCVAVARAELLDALVKLAGVLDDGASSDSGDLPEPPEIAS